MQSLKCLLYGSLKTDPGQRVKGNSQISYCGVEARVMPSRVARH